MLDKQKILFLSFSLSVFLSIASILFYFLPFFFHFICMLTFHLSPYSNMLLRLFHVVFFPHLLKFFLFSFSLTVTCLPHEQERMIKSKRTFKKGEIWIKDLFKRTGEENRDKSKERGNLETGRNKNVKQVEWEGPLSVAVRALMLHLQFHYT